MSDLTIRFFRDGERDMIHQIMAGSHGGENIRKIRAEDIEKWPVEWADYQGLAREPDEGTPLIDVPGMTTHLSLHFRLINIVNAEQLAETSDSVIQGVLGGLALRKAAKMLIERNREAEAHERSTKELREMRAEMAALREQVAMKSMADEPRRGPGRPRKAEESVVEGI